MPEYFIPKASKHPTAPIKDVNHDQVLDGKDIIAQLNKEDPLDGKRSIYQRGFGVLENFGIHDMATHIKNYAISGRALPNEAYQRLADHVNESIRSTVDSTSRALTKNPHTEENDIEALIKHEMSVGTASDDITQLVAERHHFFDFVKTFKDTFPKGVKIEAKDMPEIVSHFEGVTIPLPNPQLHPKKLNRDII